MLATGVAALDPHHFGKPDPYLHQSENQIRIRIKVKRRILIQIRTKVKGWQKESRGGESVGYVFITLRTGTTFQQFNLFIEPTETSISQKLSLRKN
jgi:hypothetical protein